MTVSPVSRRTVLKAAGLGVAGGTGLMLGMSSCGLDASPGQTAELLRSQAPLPKAYVVPLPVPPVKRPVRTAGGIDYYRVVQQRRSLEILPGLRTEVTCMAATRLAAATAGHWTR
jgi:spore coat protein A